MADLTAEFTIEPFDEGSPGPHVVKAIDAARASGAEVSVGPFGTKVEGSKDEIVRAVGAVLDASLSEGASHVTVTVTNPVAISESAFGHPVFDALRPVLEVVGADPIPPELLSKTDMPIEWEGEVIGGIRLRSLEGAVPRMVHQIAGEIGGDLSTLSREEKQQVVRMLNERGAFLIRGAVEEVADLMGVSRITIYNYLNATRAIVSTAD
ncbi:MAG: helix-turn-helix domain-containing protein [Acidimicrobiia bacterium]